MQSEYVDYLSGNNRLDFAVSLTLAALSVHACSLAAKQTLDALNSNNKWSTFISSKSPDCEFPLA